MNNDDNEGYYMNIRFTQTPIECEAIMVQMSRQRQAGI